MNEENKSTNYLNLLFGTKDMPKSLRAVWIFALYDLTSSTSNLFDPDLKDFIFGTITTIIIWVFTLFTIYNKNFRLFKIYRIIMGLYLAFYSLVLVANLTNLGGDFEENAFVVVLLFSFIGLLAVYIAMLWNKKFFVNDLIQVEPNNISTHNNQDNTESNTSFSNNITEQNKYSENLGAAAFKSTDSVEVDKTLTIEQPRSLVDKLGLHGFKIWLVILVLNHIVSVGINYWYSKKYLGVEVIFDLANEIEIFLFGVLIMVASWYIIKGFFILIGKQKVFSKNNPNLKRNVIRVAIALVLLNFLRFAIGSASVYILENFYGINYKNYYASKYEHSRPSKNTQTTNLDQQEAKNNNLSGTTQDSNVAENDRKYPEYFFEVNTGDNLTNEYTKALEYFNSSIGYLKNNDLENALTDAYSSLSYYEHPSTYLLISDIYVNKKDPDLAQYYIYKAEAFGLVYGQILNMKANLAALRGEKDIARMNRSSGQMLDMITVLGAETVYLPAYNVFYIGEKIPYDSVFGEEGYVYSQTVVSFGDFKSNDMVPTIGSHNDLIVYEDIVVDSAGMPIDIDGNPKSEVLSVNKGEGIEILANTLEYMYVIGQQDENGNLIDTYYTVYKVKYKKI